MASGSLSLAPLLFMEARAINCDAQGSAPARAGQPAVAAAAAAYLRLDHRAHGTAPPRAQPTRGECTTQASHSKVDAELAAAARDTLLAQCSALLSLGDAEQLPHDPLFDLLPPPGAAAAAARRRAACAPPCDLAVALASAARDLAALAQAAAGGVVAESSLAATLFAPPTCCRKRGADAVAPATRMAYLVQRRLQQQLCCRSPALGTAAGAAAAATPCEPRAGGRADGKRQRLLLLSGGARGGRTPVSGGGSNSKVPPAQRKAQRVVRDLTFTPAPASRQQLPTGTPQTAGSASRCSAARLSPLRQQTCILRPFNLLRSPTTRAGIDKLNRRIKASAAAHTHLELQPRWATPPGDAAAHAHAPAASQPPRRGFKAVRFC